MLERYEELNIGAAVLLVCCVRLRPVNSDLVAEECESMDTVFRMTVPTQPILRHVGVDVELPLLQVGISCFYLVK